MHASKSLLLPSFRQHLYSRALPPHLTPHDSRNILARRESARQSWAGEPQTLNETPPVLAMAYHEVKEASARWPDIGPESCIVRRQLVHIDTRQVCLRGRADAGKVGGRWREVLLPVVGVAGRVIGQEGLGVRAEAHIAVEVESKVRAEAIERGRGAGIDEVLDRRDARPGVLHVVA